MMVLVAVAKRDDLRIYRSVETPSISRGGRPVRGDVRERKSGGLHPYPGGQEAEHVDGIAVREDCMAIA